MSRRSRRVGSTAGIYGCPRIPRGVGAYGPRPSIQRTPHTSPLRLNGHGEPLALSPPAAPTAPASLVHAVRLEHMPRAIDLDPSRRVSHYLFRGYSLPCVPSRTYCVVMALAGMFRSCWLSVCQPAPELSQQPHLPLRRSTRSFHACDALALGAASESRGMFGVVYGRRMMAAYQRMMSSQAEQRFPLQAPSGSPLHAASCDRHLRYCLYQTLILGGPDLGHSRSWPPAIPPVHPAERPFASLYHQA